MNGSTQTQCQPKYVARRRERHTHTETDRLRQRDRDRQREGGRETDRQTDRQSELHQSGSELLKMHEAARTRTNLSLQLCLKQPSKI